MKPRFQYWATFLLVKDLLQGGEDGSVIADKIGEERGDVQWCRRLMALPTYVQEEYRTFFLRGLRATSVRIADIKSLIAAYDRGFPDESKEFRQLWKTILTR